MAFLRSVAARFAQRYYAKRLAAGCRSDQAEGRGIVRAQADSVRRAAFKDETAGLASRGIEHIYELTYIRKDGNRFPAVLSVTALRDAQNAAARPAVLTRSLIESNIDALMTTDPSDIITDVNKQMEALTDCRRDELIGAPVQELLYGSGASRGSD